jgi:DNA-binding SARP family transcriptional activator
VDVRDVASPSLTIRLFGPLRIERNGREAPTPASRKTRAILGLLVLSKRPVGRERLCELLFDVPDDPRAALRWSLSKLRPLIDDPDAKRMVAERDAVRFFPAGATVDVLQVLAAAERSVDSIELPEIDRCLDFMSGELMEDAELPERVEYSAWLAAQRQDFSAIARRLARAAVDLAPPEQKIGRLYRLLSLDPLDEPSAAELASRLVQSGRTDDAHAVVTQMERAFRLAGLRPGPGLRFALRSATVSPTPPQRPAEVEPAPQRDGRVSVALIPFLNHTQGAVPEDLADGFLEASVHMLSKFRDLRVAGWSSGLQFKGKVMDPAAMGDTLAVGHLVGGSLMVREGKLWVRYRIASAQTGSLTHSGDIEHPGATSLALLEEAPSDLVVLIAHHLADIGRKRALATPPHARTAHDHYLCGIQAGFFDVPTDYGIALQCFDRALALEPDAPVVEAYAAWAKAGLGHGFDETSRLAAVTQAHRAIANGADDAEALAIGAWAAVHLAQDFELALRVVDQAVRINPLSRIAWSASAWVRAMAGEFEAPLQHWDNAERWNPLGTGVANTYGGRALCYWMGGRFASAAAAAKRCLEHLPGHLGGHMAAVAAQVMLGDQDAARRAASAMLALAPLGADTPAIAAVPIRNADVKAQLLAAVRRGCALAAAN